MMSAISDLTLPNAKCNTQLKRMNLVHGESTPYIFRPGVTFPSSSTHARTSANLCELVLIFISRGEKTILMNAHTQCENQWICFHWFSALALKTCNSPLHPTLFCPSASSLFSRLRTQFCALPSSHPVAPRPPLTTPLSATDIGRKNQHVPCGRCRVWPVLLRFACHLHATSCRAARGALCVCIL